MQLKNLLITLSLLSMLNVSSNYLHASCQVLETNEESLPQSKKLYIKGKQLAALSDVLKEKLAQQSFKGIVAVTRGGLVPAGYLAHRLGIRTIETLGLSSYDDQSKQQKVLKVEKPLDLQDGGEGWLIVDDISDTGKTFEYIQNLFPKAHRLAYIVKPQGEKFVNVYAMDVAQDTWVVFPWEID
ncbi:xanthine phosphoribosyltransferase [Candidatus Nucleicultrix amoebiphila]|jgi:xanthine phosphoribosyltransferase|uniref:xanthine phosphoribosyltransferase n=1 Tax=Candidatus Nucleicultrix amoebiphila TaxID=1509244 RepID=UPI000A26E632|nr:xanthine phosphoribosyltransferase [Candidatus Nucleicultrix amoebiphila]